MIILMRFSTGEDWNVYMYDYGNMEDCLVTQTYDEMFGENGKIEGCGSNFASFYFISF
jgi:hypothetical protein